MDMHVEKGRSTEDRFTGAIESQTSQVPSSGYLGVALGCMAVSAILKLTRKNDWAMFVGQWAAPLLIMGVYNKMVKQHGSDARSDNGLGDNGLADNGDLQSAA